MCSRAVGLLAARGAIDLSIQRCAVVCRLVMVLSDKCTRRPRLHAGRRIGGVLPTAKGPFADHHCVCSRAVRLSGRRLVDPLLWSTRRCAVVSLVLPEYCDCLRDIELVEYRFTNKQRKGLLVSPIQVGPPVDSAKGLWMTMCAGRCHSRRAVVHWRRPLPSSSGC